MRKEVVQTSSSGGIGLGGILFIVFLVLKLTGKVDWSWLWVTAPLWLPFAIGIGIVFIVVIIAAILGVVFGVSFNKKI